MTAPQKSLYDRAPFVDDYGNMCSTFGTAIAGERGVGSATPYGDWLAAHEEWQYYQFNPRAASTNTTLGAAGSAGTTEILVLAGNIILGGIYTEPDTAAGNILVRDAVAAGTSAIARAFPATLNTYSAFEPNWILNNGLCVNGTATGIMFTVKYRVR